MKLPYQTVGYRFWETAHNSDFYQLFALGHDRVTSAAYDWNGLTRIDGPLYLFQYTISGWGHAVMDGHTHRVNPGHAFLVDIPGNHRYYLPEASPFWEFSFILFRPSKLEKHWQEAIRRLSRVPHIPPGNPVILCLQDMIRAAVHDRISDGYLASSMLYRFVMELLRLSTGRLLERNTWPAAIQQAVRELEGGYRAMQGLDGIAAAAGLSKYHFVRLFKRYTGITPIEYLTKIRIQRSIELLRETDLSVDRIAKEIGYSGSSYFVKVFRKWVGFTPGEFRLGREVMSLQQMKFD